MLASQLIVGALAAFLVVGPAIYGLVPLGPIGRSLSYERAVAIALVGFAIGGLASLLLGWIPLVGQLVAPAAWVGVLLLLEDIERPTAIGVGLVAWAISAVVLMAARLIA